MEIIINAIIQNLVEIAIILTVTLIGVAGAWLAAKLGKSEHLSSIKAATEQATAAAEQTVLELKQTVVDDLKAAAADGKLTKDEILDLNRKLVSQSMAKMSDTAVALLTAAGVDITALIIGAGEAMVQKIKSPRTEPPDTTELPY